MFDELKVSAEQSVISSLMVDQKTMEKVYGLLSPEMFEDAILGRIFLEYRRAYDAHKEISLSELQEMVMMGGYREYEVEDALSRCLDTRLTSIGIESDAKVIKDKFKKSCVDNILSHIELNSAGIDEQVSDLIHQLEQYQGGGNIGAKTIAQLSEDLKDGYFCDSGKPRAELGVRQFDELIGGFEGGDLIIIGARPAVGKSALVAQWAENFANRGLKVGFFNLEMTNKQIFERFVASKSGIEITRLRMATRFLDGEKEKYDRANETLKKQNMLYVSTGMKKVSDIRLETHKMKYDIIIVDYLQLLTAEDTYKGNRAAEVGEISRRLKAIAIDYNIPVIALSQLNRQSEGRAGKEPTMGELREAGNLEQDASVIILMWNKDENDPTQKGCKVEKSRQGKVGRCDMVFYGKTMRFKTEDEVTPFD